MSSVGLISEGKEGEGGRQRMDDRNGEKTASSGEEEKDRGREAKDRGNKDRGKSGTRHGK